MDKTTPLYIFGHKSPDSDSICSAIAYSALKQKLGYAHATAYRLGPLNKETTFVLDYFKVPAPPLLEDLKIRLKDLTLYDPIKLDRKAPLKKAWDALKVGGGARLIPIVTPEGLLEGTMSIADIATLFMEHAGEDLVKHFEIRFDNLLDILGGRLVQGQYPYETLQGRLLVGGTDIESATFTDKDVVLTSNPEKAYFFAKRGCGAVLLTADAKPPEDFPETCALVRITHSLHKAMGMSSQAISIHAVMNTQGFDILSTESTISDTAEMMKTSTHRNFPVVDRNGRLFGVISRRHLIEYDRKKAVLIDHNERTQSVNGLEQAQIVEIIDHHRVADVQTDAPLTIRSEPVGCTATIVKKLYAEAEIPIDPPIAGLLLSAILSDTLMFRSPTCTTEDKAAAEALAQLANVDLKKYGGDMFSAGTSLSGFTPEQILTMDRKQFSFDKYFIYISQVNTLDFNTIVTQKQALLDAMGAFRAASNSDVVILMITDILLGGSEILVSSQGGGQELMRKAFNMTRDEVSIFLPGVVSRKKQIVPRLAQATQM